MAYGSSPQKKRMLTDSQKKRLKEHKVHHTSKHMSMMRKLMKDGMSFKRAHDKTMKEIGK
jgi:hypothetical protein